MNWQYQSIWFWSSYFCVTHHINSYWLTPLNVDVNLGGCFTSHFMSVVEVIGCSMFCCSATALTGWSLERGRGLGQTSCRWGSVARSSRAVAGGLDRLRVSWNGRGAKDSNGTSSWWTIFFPTHELLRIELFVVWGNHRNAIISKSDWQHRVCESKQPCGRCDAQGGKKWIWQGNRTIEYYWATQSKGIHNGWRRNRCNMLQLMSWVGPWSRDESWCATFATKDTSEDLLQNGKGIIHSLLRQVLKFFWFTMVHLL